MDSGVGGLPYLASARPLLSHENLLYLADRAGFPYGTKSREEVEAIVLDRVERARRAWKPKALVIACNTASQAALAAVRRANTGFPVVGTVPAVKPAAERTRSGVIGVMATAGAVEDPYLAGLVARFAPGTTVLREGAQDLVAFVERRFLASTAEERRQAVLPSVRRLVESGADEIILACTHFLHVAADIEACATELSSQRGGPRVEVIDSREGVARRLRAVLLERGLLAVPPLSGGDRGVEGDKLLLTGPEPFEPVYAGFARRFGLSGPYPLDSSVL